MKKIFTFLFAALMSVGMFATTYTVTFTNLNSVVKVVENITLPHTFSCDYTNGNGELDLIIQESYNDTGHCDNSRSPWGGNDNEVVVGQDGNNHFVTINAPFVGTSFLSGYYDGINFGTFYYSFHITIAAAEPEPAKYYVVGNMTEWAVDENYEMNPNIYAETEEYFYALDLTTTSEFKVVKVEGENQTWYPTGMGNNYGQNGEITEDAEYTIYFRPNYDGGEDWFYNCIYVSKNEPQPAGEVTVVFAANNKTVERTVTLPHTFKCSWAAGMDEPDELDIIIHELYNDYYYCNNNIQASGSDQVEAGTEEDPKNDYITIKGVFEGTATVTGDYFDWITGEEGAHNYSITISIKGDEPQGMESIQPSAVSSQKVLRNGMLLIEKNGVVYNVLGAQVR